MKSVSSGRLAVIAFGAWGAISTMAVGQYLSFDSSTQSSQFTNTLGPRWVGDAVSLDANAPTLTVVAVSAGLNSSGVSDPLPPGDIRLRLRLWSGFNPTSNPVFSNLLSEQIIPSNFTSVSGYLSLRGPWVLPTPVTLPSRTPVGVSIAYEVWNGTSWTMSTLATPTMFAGSPAPNVGGSAMPNGKGVYRRVGGSPVTDGNFAPADYTSGGSLPSTSVWLLVWTECTGDFTYNQIVDDSDFVDFAHSYDILDCADASMPVGCPADLNGDQIVDDSDFAIFASAYDTLMCS